jgi:hypothetical protein
VSTVGFFRVFGRFAGGSEQKAQKAERYEVRDSRTFCFICLAILAVCEREFRLDDLFALPDLFLLPAYVEIQTSNCRRQTLFRVCGRLASLELGGPRGLPGLCLFNCLALLDKVVEVDKPHGRLGEAVVHSVVLPHEARRRGTRFLRLLHTAGHPKARLRLLESDVH